MFKICAVFFILIFGLSLNGNAQNRLHISAFGGFSNYQGDLQYRRYTMEQSFAAFALGLSYDITPNITIRGLVARAKLGAHDQYNLPALQFRNLSFETVLYEGSIVGQYRFFDLSERKFTPYIFGGFALFRFQPYTFDTLGNKRFLKPLSTEGQGLSQYPERKPYNNIQAAIPFGGGIKLRVTENAVIGFELGLRKLFTDYLDDVSTSYPDPNILLAEKGPRSVELSYRGDELKDGNLNFPAGNIRGSAKYKDWYYFTGITLEIGLNTGNLFGSFNKNNSIRGMGCPVNVY